MKKSIIWGSIIGLIFIFIISQGIGFQLGIPLAIGVDQVGKFLVVVLLAPILEELAFRFVILGWLLNKFTLTKGKLLISAIVSSLLFSIYHIAVYGSLIDKSALFFSAFIFGMTMVFLLYKLHNNRTTGWYPNQIGNIIAHMFVNFGVISSTLVIGFGIA